MASWICYYAIIIKFIKVHRKFVAAAALEKIEEAKKEELESEEDDEWNSSTIKIFW